MSDDDWAEVERILRALRVKQKYTEAEMIKLTEAALEDQRRYTKLYETTKGKK